MARRALPDDVRRAIGEHAHEVHGIEEVAEPEIGRRGSRRATVNFTWEKGDEFGPSFRCRHCQQGLDRYFVEVGREEPSERLLGLADAHFRLQHGRSLDPAALWHAGNRCKERVATFMPMTPQVGAAILCARCPQGMNRIYLTEAPSGDARRIRALLRERPELREQTRGFETKEQAEYVEAWDRSLLQERDRLSGRRALRRAAAAGREPALLDSALERLLLTKAPGGRGITQAIRELARLAREEPVQFTCEVGRELPALAEPARSVPPQEFALAVARFLGEADGRYPTVSERKLWELWRGARS